VKYIVNSSRERIAYVSLDSVFTGGPTLKAPDQLPNLSGLRDEEPGAARYDASTHNSRDRLMIAPMKDYNARAAKFGLAP
jgi:hypothetical protein